MVVSVALQAAAGREHLHEALQVAAGGADVVFDPAWDGKPNPWRTYRGALESTPAGASHRVVVQDDARMCTGFREQLEQAVAARPDSMVVLWHGGQPRENVYLIDRAYAAGQAWVELDIRRWVPVVAVCWPVRLIRPALEWVDGEKYPPAFRSDDEIVGRAMRALGERVYATVPSLVQHDDLEPSLMGKRGRNGQDPGRVARVFRDDPGRVDWHKGC